MRILSMFSEEIIRIEFSEGQFFLACERKSHQEKPSILSENERELLRFHSASVERAIPGYAGHRKIQPELYHNSLTRVDSHYGPRYTDKSPIHPHSSFKVSLKYSSHRQIASPNKPRNDTVWWLVDAIFLAVNFFRKVFSLQDTVSGIQYP